MYDVIVVGGGVIGLSIARELAGRKSVLLLDRGSTGQGTSRAAAGMLTPLSEANDQGPFFQLCRASHAMYARFVDELQRQSFLSSNLPKGFHVDRIVICEDAVEVENQRANHASL